jgi:hypothetical protein
VWTRSLELRPRTSKARSEGHSQTVRTSSTSSLVKQVRELVGVFSVTTVNSRACRFLIISGTPVDQTM